MYCKAIKFIMLLTKFSQKLIKYTDMFFVEKKTFKKLDFLQNFI